MQYLLLFFEFQCLLYQLYKWLARNTRTADFDHLVYQFENLLIKSNLPTVVKNNNNNKTANNNNKNKQTHTRITVHQ